jgi:hypothetical protein
MSLVNVTTPADRAERLAPPKKAGSASDRSKPPKIREGNTMWGQGSRV